MVKTKQLNCSTTGFALPLVLILGSLLICSSLSLQSMAMQSRAKGIQLWQEGQLNDGFLTAAMAFVAAARHGESSPNQSLAAGIFQLESWQGSAYGPAQLKVQRLSSAGKPMRSRSFQLSSEAKLKPVSP